MVGTEKTFRLALRGLWAGFRFALILHLREQGSRRQYTDYYALRQMRGSVPTAQLPAAAAGLSLRTGWTSAFSPRRRLSRSATLSM